MEQYRMPPAARMKLPDYITMPVQDMEEPSGFSNIPIVDLIEEESILASDSISPAGTPAREVCLIKF